MSDIFSVVCMRESSSSYNGDSHLSSEGMQFEYFHSFEEMVKFYLRKEKRDWNEVHEYNSQYYNHVTKYGLEWIFMLNGVLFSMIEDAKEWDFWNEKFDAVQKELKAWKRGRQEEIKQKKISETIEKERIREGRRYQEYLELKKEFENGGS